MELFFPFFFFLFFFTNVENIVFYMKCVYMAHFISFDIKDSSSETLSIFKLVNLVVKNCIIFS